MSVPGMCPSDCARRPGRIAVDQQAGDAHPAVMLTQRETEQIPLPPRNQTIQTRRRKPFQPIDPIRANRYRLQTRCLQCRHDG